jgi:hypothetical protein
LIFVIFSYAAWNREHIEKHGVGANEDADTGRGDSVMVAKPKAKPFSQMTAAEREAFVRNVEQGIPATRLKPLSLSDKALWRAARRAPGRPRKAAGAKSVPVRVTFEPKLLQEIDAYAQSNGLTRAQLLARGAKLAMGKEPAA